jgi:hypothetical protein
MLASTFGNDRFAIRLFHGQVEIAIRSHDFSATLSAALQWQDFELSSIALLLAVQIRSVAR